MFGKGLQADSGTHAGGGVAVLQRDRHAVERADGLAARHRHVGSPRSGAGGFLVEGDDGVEERIDQRNAGKLRLHRLDGAGLSVADRRRQFTGGQEGGVRVGYGRVPHSGGSKGVGKNRLRGRVF